MTAHGLYILCYSSHVGTLNHDRPCIHQVHGMTCLTPDPDADPDANPDADPYADPDGF